MLEITNKNKFMVPVMVRSRTATRSFTTLNIPGVGSGKNVVCIEDELVTPNLKKMEEDYGLITTRTIPDNSLQKKGE